MSISRIACITICLICACALAVLLVIGGYSQGGAYFITMAVGVIAAFTLRFDK